MPRDVVFRPRIIGQAETFAQLPLPEPLEPREWTYEPFVESA